MLQLCFFGSYLNRYLTVVYILRRKVISVFMKYFIFKSNTANLVYSFVLLLYLLPFI